MEPFDIDKIIKNKILESHESHKHEMDSAKPFVWSAIQNQIGKQTLTWIHLAAAAVLLLISFSFVFYSLQKGHKNEIIQLSNKIDQLQKDYLSQAELLHTKNIEVESMSCQLNNVELQLTDLLQQKPLSQKETIVYLTDTVYLKQVEYITTIADPMEPKMKSIATAGEQSEQIETSIIREKEIDYIIYPSYSSQGKNQQAETIKFKFGSLSASRK